MLKLLKPANPEDVFIQRYDLLMGWGLALTSGNRAQAEDLVHDAFIQFTLRRSELGAIENTDAYLNRMLRNMYLSQIRRATLIHDPPFSIANFDSAEIGLRAIDPRERVDVQDDLRQICQYACARKEGSKAGCVLILRFFHGYYPSEIALILRTSRKAVDRYLMLARREAKLYLSNPEALKFTAANPPAKISQIGYVRTTSDLLSELRTTIFASCRDECAEADQLKQLYAKTSGAVEVAVISHVVSCPRCLDTVNGLLGIPLLAERNSDDRLGRDVPPDSSGGGGDISGGGSVVDSQRRYHRRFRETIEHRPQELRIAVNGFVLGAQEVSSEFNKQVLSVNIDEPIGFIEVFSEQGLRLLFFDVDQPIDGSVEQTARAEFDCGRALDLCLNFRGPWPSLNVAYHDPTFEAVESHVEGRDFEVQSLEEIQSPTSNPHSRAIIPTVREGSALGPFAKVRVGFARFINKQKDFGFWTGDFGLLLRPGTITALFALVLVAVAILFFRSAPTPPLSAADLLQKAAASEEVIASNRDHVIHRTLQLEEKSATGQLIASRRIEVWQSAEKGITARRLYNENGSLISGEWRRADGGRTIYHHGKGPELPIRNPQSGIRNFEDAWLLDPTAKEFASLIGGSQNAQARETADTYVVSYDDVNANSTGLIRASLVLGRADLHAVEQTLVVRQGDEVREYKFTETSFERRRSDSVAPAVFEPDAGLLSLETRNPPGGTSNTSMPVSVTGPAPPTLATAALEVEVIDALNSAGAFMGEQVGVSRTADGQITVSALVETDQRKRDLLAALANYRNNPAVRTRIETVAEAEARARRPGDASTSQPGSVQQVEVTERVSPVFAELKKKFSEEEAHRYSERVLARSRQAWLHAAAMKQLSQRFSTVDLASLSSAERSRWLGLIREHADAFVREAQALRRELAQVFPEAAGGGGSPGAIGGDIELQARVRELYDAAVAIDRGMNTSFGLGSSGSAPVKGAGFWNSFSRGLGIARSIQGVR